MEKLTITEALSEVNLIKKKVGAKQQKVLGALVRPAHTKDLYESDGGSKKMIESEAQAINDLNRRLAKIRSAISDANLSNEITLGEDTRTIHDWLTWKREIVNSQIHFTKSVHTTVKNMMDKIAKEPQVYVNEEGKQSLVQAVPNVDMAYWVRQEEILNEKLEQLDGKLSLKNATINISL